jgi:hypothetical protein
LGGVVVAVDVAVGRLGLQSGVAASSEWSLASSSDVSSFPDGGANPNADRSHAVAPIRPVTRA